MYSNSRKKQAYVLVFASLGIFGYLFSVMAISQEPINAEKVVLTPEAMSQIVGAANCKQCVQSGSNIYLGCGRKAPDSNNNCTHLGSQTNYQKRCNGAETEQKCHEWMTGQWNTADWDCYTVPVDDDEDGEVDFWYCANSSTVNYTGNRTWCYMMSASCT